MFKIVITNLFHYSSNSLSRHLEKISHYFIEPKIGITTPLVLFQPKKAKKKYFIFSPWVSITSVVMILREFTESVYSFFFIRFAR